MSTRSIAQSARNQPVRLRRYSGSTLVNLRYRKIQKLVAIFFLLLLTEGVFRKWLLNGIQQPLLFIRDPILLWIYIEYARVPRSKMPNWAVAWGAAALLFILLTAVQATLILTPALVFMLGLRSYIAYVPLAFIIAEVFDEFALGRFVKLSLMCSLPVAVLVAGQFFSPVGSPINKGLIDGTRGIFLVADGIVRPYGPFTFVLGQSTYASMMVAFVLIAWEKRSVYKIGMALLVSATVAVTVMGALSGARTFFGGAILVVLAYLLASLSGGRPTQGLSRIIFVVLLSAVFFFTFIVIFPTSFSAMSSRQVQAEHAEGSTLARGLSMFTQVGQSISSAPPFGHGIGAGSNAGAFISSGGTAGDWTLGEYEWPRIVQELGPFAGILFIAFRVGLSALLALKAFHANRRARDPAALTLFGFSGYLLLTAQVVGQNQMLSFCWLTVGITMAFANCAHPESHSNARGGIHGQIRP